MSLASNINNATDHLNTCSNNGFNNTTNSNNLNELSASSTNPEMDVN